MAPKTYLAVDFDENKTKRSTKGIQARNKLNYETFKSALYAEKTVEVENVSLRMRKNQMQTSKVSKVGLKNTFVKGEILEDGISIAPFKKCI